MSVVRHEHLGVGRLGVKRAFASTLLTEMLLLLYQKADTLQEHGRLLLRGGATAVRRQERESYIRTQIFDYCRSRQNEHHCAFANKILTNIIHDALILYKRLFCSTKQRVIAVESDRFTVFMHFCRSPMQSIQHCAYVPNVAIVGNAMLALQQHNRQTNACDDEQRRCSG